MKQTQVNHFQKRHFYLALIFLIGFTSLIYEIYSTRILFFFFSETNWAITIGITSFLAGIAFSSLFFSSLIKKQEKNVFLILWIMQIAIGMYGFFFLRHYEVIPQLLDFLFAKSTNLVFATGIKIILIWLFLFVPAFFIGGSFPLVNGLYLKNLDKKIHDTSVVYFWDTFGSLMGGLMTGFWFLPYFGFQITATIGVIINLFIAVWIAPKNRYRIFTILFLLWIVVQLFILQFWIKTDPLRDFYLNNTYLDQKFGDVLFQKVSPYGVVTIGNNTFGMRDNKTLFINYREMCLSKQHQSETALGALTAQQLPTNAKVLNIGLGCGFTANAIAQQKNVNNLGIVEINPVVAQGTQQYFKDENNNVVNNPKVKLTIQDGAVYVRNTQNKYNAVVIDIEEANIIDSSPLYTREYFTYIHNILVPNGILAMWVPREQNEFEKVLYNTLKTSFKYVTIRLVESVPAFYASDKQYPGLLPQDPDEKAAVNEMMQTPVTDVNTLDKRVLEKYYSIKDTFRFPTGYNDPNANDPEQ